MPNDSTSAAAPFRVMEWLEAAQAEIYEDIKDLSAEEEIAYYQRKVAESEFAELWESLPKIERSRREMSLPDEYVRLSAE
jgi:hypothetical protein